MAQLKGEIGHPQAGGGAALARWRRHMQACGVEELMRTNDLVLISVVEALLHAENIRYFVADTHMSALEGSLGFLPRRVLVHQDDQPKARRLMIEAGFAPELRPETRHD